MKQKAGEPACPVSQLMMGAYRIFKDDLQKKVLGLIGFRNLLAKNLVPVIKLLSLKHDNLLLSYSSFFPS
ncbi:MAG: hypothetical protein ACFFDT_30180 [Candidatus Hodarchaeota archaeon]